MARTLSRVLIANRGEIAVRIARTCRRLGVETVAVFSDADADAPHVRAADLAVRIGPAPSRDSYLVVEKILAAAVKSGADAIHPGYGFLAENAAFAAEVKAAGLVWIGPTAQAIETMGSKIEAKKCVSAAGVPIVPGYNGASQETEVLVAKAHEVGFPLLLKASAGGGGKGMRIVREGQDIESAIDAARREALSAFGDGRLMIERYIERPRHIEFQIFGDEHGEVVHLFERECSIQRRHQKIIEETPSTALDDGLRAEMGQAAVKVGRAIGYTNAGTVEFILDPEGSFYFLEVNTRLQVEHPITEMVTGVDLVEWQLCVAVGGALPLSQAEISARGAAVECRIYAEDSQAGFLPSTGRLIDWHLDESAEGVRLDTGVETGQEVSVHYDPMLAKLVTHGSTRAEANRKMLRALAGLSVHGVKTNRTFLMRVLRHPAYIEGELSTHFIDEHMSSALADPPCEASERRALVAATLASFALRARTRNRLNEIEPGFRNNDFAPQSTHWTCAGRQVEVTHRNKGGGRLEVGFDQQEETFEATLVSFEALHLVMELEGVRRQLRVVFDGADVFVQGLDTAVNLRAEPRFPEQGVETVEGGCTAPMPGQVLRVCVEAGQEVEEGTPLVILEAMKMEHIVQSAEVGRVAEILVEAGDQVEVDAILVVLE